MLDSQMPEGEPFHVRVRAERKRRHMTQAEAAELAGMKPRAYQEFEAGRTTPQPANMRGIRAAFDLDSVTAEGGNVVEKGERPDVCPECQRTHWPLDIEIFTDMISGFLADMDPQARSRWIHEETRHIMDRWRETRR